jgi:hypothetical protein
VIPYRAGVRASRTTGGPIYVFEFRPAPPGLAAASSTDAQLEVLMNAIEQYVTDVILKALHKQAPALSAADDAKVTKAVTDFVTTGMDLAAVYFALRAAKAAK